MNDLYIVNNDGLGSLFYNFCSSPIVSLNLLSIFSNVFENLA